MLSKEILSSEIDEAEDFQVASLNGGDELELHAKAALARTLRITKKLVLAT